MAPWLALLGLCLEIVGVFLLLRDELNPLAAQVRQADFRPETGLWIRLVCWFAKRFGSSRPQDQESYVAESLAGRVAGLLLILLGFVVQSAGVVIYLVQDQ